MLPWDFEVWRAMSVPPGVLIPENTIIVSAEGRGVSDMAGGDYDGDIVMLSFCAELVALGKAIAVHLTAFDLQGMKKAMGNWMGAKTGTPLAVGSAQQRAEQYFKFAREFQVDNIRGKMTALAERAFLRVLLEKGGKRRQLADGAEADDSLSRALLLGICSHAATDVPKHKTSAQVWAVARRLSRALELDVRGARCSVHLGKKLRIFERPLKKMAIIQLAQETLQTAVGREAYGRYWLPAKTYVLGHAAGRLVAKAILAAPSRFERYYERDATRTVIGEIAFLLRHRFQGKFEPLVRAGDRGAFADIVQQTGRTTLKCCTTGTLSHLERSLHA